MFRSKPVVPGGRPIIAIGYDYNVRKVLFLIVTENTGITGASLPYLSNYPDQFSNVSTHPVAHPIVMYKFFSSVNKVESHNKSK